MDEHTRLRLKLPYCNSCKERHYGDDCPPHEVRTTGIAWFRGRIADLEDELELAENKIKKLQKYAVAGKGLIEVIQGMCEPETREGDPVDGYIQVYSRQKAEIEQLKEELEAEQLWIKEGKKLHDVQKVKIEKEKRARLYYQTIVYNVCCTLDVIQGKKTMCGTSETPTTKVQEAVAKISSEISQLKHRLREAFGGCKMFSQRCDCGLCERDRAIGRLRRILTEQGETK